MPSPISSSSPAPFGSAARAASRSETRSATCLIAPRSRGPSASKRVSFPRRAFEPTERGPDGHPRVEVGGAYVEFHEGDPEDSDRPLLNHLAVLVDSADEHTEEAEDRGIVDRVVDAANTRAVFVWGPDRVRIEYVEHKPGFALT